MLLLALCGWVVVTAVGLIGLAVVAPRALPPVLATTGLILAATAAVALLFAL